MNSQLGEDIQPQPQPQTQTEENSLQLKILFRKELNYIS